MAHSAISGRVPCWFMAEFFILKAQRQRGYGQAALRDILSRHSGNWEIAAINWNLDAVSFWMNALLKIGVKDLKKEARTYEKLEWTLHKFVS